MWARLIIRVRLYLPSDGDRRLHHEVVDAAVEEFVIPIGLSIEGEGIQLHFDVALSGLAAECAKTSSLISFAWNQSPEPNSEKNKGGWKTQGRGKHTIKPLPQKRFWTSPPMIRFSPPFVFALLFSLEETGTDQANPTF